MRQNKTRELLESPMRDNQQPSPTGKVQRLSRKGVRFRPEARDPSLEGEDIVHSILSV